MQGHRDRCVLRRRHHMLVQNGVGSWLNVMTTNIASPFRVVAAAPFDVEHAGKLVTRAVLRPGEPEVGMERAENS